MIKKKVLRIFHTLILFTTSSVMKQIDGMMIDKNTGLLCF